MKEVTIQDIAAAARVSKSTVSRVLNGTAAVHPDKKRAVVEATARLGFRPNIVAQSLANGKSMTIGVLTQLIGSPFYDTIAQGVVAALGGTGYSPLFVDGQWQREAEVEAIRALLGRRVDGLVLIGGDVPADEIARLCGGLPTIIVARELPRRLHNCIFMDNVDGGRQATKHLLDMGHREIAVVCGVEQHPDAINRLRGYKSALREADVMFDPDLVIPGDFTADSGVNAINELLDRGKRFTAVFAANDIAAFGARLGCHRNGLRVPEDISIIGFDDQMEAAYVTPPLTTIRQPAREMGAQASQAVLDLIRGGVFKSRALTGKLQVRESVANLQQQ